ncbi:MAG: hypothetical protein GX118_07595 [Arcobacter butzleri]|jgi:hypothetical protein|nr:nitrous oxide-stimulated promoter family protein [Arcobacteraceae bacterium]MDY0364468.1 nitrous oxide-stimulated promoter family protein [Arcobacteraceae bacterium]NLO18037.1 hypothetical protein [Aliarcobacter butzleri]
MTLEKFEQEVLTLKKFFETYCIGKGYECKERNIKTSYKNKEFEFKFFICDKSYELVLYAIDRLLECPHEEKPKCRTCPAPCYEKQKYKEVARVMKYSGIRLGLSKIKRFFGG